MALDHTKPPESLLRELDEVAHAAQALVEVMARGLNFPLPPDFPTDQLTDICRSLMRLPEGTAEGARSPLDYARHRLPAIRRQYVLSEGVAERDSEPSLTRGAALDQKLTALMTAVSTAFDEYRSLASEEAEDFKAEAGIVPKKGSVDEATTRAAQLDETLAAASGAVDEMADPASRKADDLKRQLKDARGLNQLASAEMRMPRVVVGWLRKTVDALKKSPAVIAKTVAAIRVGVDVSKVFLDRWHEFHHDGAGFIYAQIHKTLDSFEKAADIVSKAQNGNAKEEESEPAEEPTQIERASSRRLELQRKVRTHLDDLDAFDKGNAETPARDMVENELLADLQELTRLETFIKMHRQLSADNAGQRGNSAEPPLGRAGHGMTHRAFARLAIIAIRRAGHPLESGEVVEELRKIGHPIGGTHEIKTAYNRLWEAKKTGVLTHMKGVGYWIAGRELPETALDGVAAVRAARRKSRKKDHSRIRGKSSRRPGASDALSSGEKEAARKMLRSGKSVHEVARYFDVSDATMRRYLRDDLETLREENGGRLPPRRVRRSSKSNGPRKITKKLGRRPTLSDEQVATMVSMRSAGKSVETIAGEFGVSIDVVYRHLRDHKAGES